MVKSTTESVDNRRKLIAHKMAIDIVPSNTGNAYGACLSALSKPGNLAQMYRDADSWVTQAIAMVKTAPDNPFVDDDAIIKHLLDAVEKRKAEQMAELRSAQ